MVGSEEFHHRKKRQRNGEGDASISSGRDQKDCVEGEAEVTSLVIKGDCLRGEGFTKEPNADDSFGCRPVRTKMRKGRWGGNEWCEKKNLTP